jgi:hypothetical protein
MEILQKNAMNKSFYTVKVQAVAEATLTIIAKNSDEAIKIVLNPNNGLLLKNLVEGVTSITASVKKEETIKEMDKENPGCPDFY